MNWIAGLRIVWWTLLTRGIDTTSVKLIKTRKNGLLTYFTPATLG